MKQFALANVCVFFYSFYIWYNYCLYKMIKYPFFKNGLFFKPHDDSEAKYLFYV